MKHLLNYLFVLLLLGCIFIGCSDQQAPTGISEESNTTLNKATIIKDSFDYDYDAESLPFTDCVTGASMQNHGIVKANYKIVLTPSGHYIETGHVDYDAYGGVTLENLSTGEIWTLQNGTNPWHWIEYDNGSFRFHYLWNEVYKSGNQVLNLHLQGFITVDKNGNVTKEIETYSCN
jgi:hypothetical protein